MQNECRGRQGGGATLMPPEWFLSFPAPDHFLALLNGQTAGTSAKIAGAGAMRKLFQGQGPSNPNWAQVSRMRYSADSKTLAVQRA